MRKDWEMQQVMSASNEQLKMNRKELDSRNEEIKKLQKELEEVKKLFIEENRYGLPLTPITIETEYMNNQNI